MANLDLILDVDGDDFNIHFHPESLVLMTYDLKQEGLSDEEISIKIEAFREYILADYKQRLESGEINAEDFEKSNSSGCGDPNCTNCGTSVVYH